MATGTTEAVIEPTSLVGDDALEISVKETKKRGRSPSSSNSKPTAAATPKNKKKKKAPAVEATPTTKPQRKRYRTQKQVHDLLKKLGVAEPTKVCGCLKEGLRKEHITLLPPSEDPDGKHGLDQIIASSTCLVCGEYNIEATLRDILYQGDVGYDYEDGAPDSNVQCPSGDCCGYYVASMCSGTPELDTGKFYNHCTACAGFGRCLGDYRETHCPKCNKHYFAAGGFGCYTCNPGSFDMF